MSLKDNRLMTKTHTEFLPVPVILNTVELVKEQDGQVKDYVHGCVSHHNY